MSQSGVFLHIFEKGFEAQLDTTQNAFKLMLMQPSYQPDFVNDVYVSKASPYEFNGQGYVKGYGSSSRLILNNVKFNYNSQSQSLNIVADRVNYVGLTSGIIGAVLVIMETGGSDATSYLIACIGPEIATNLPFAANGAPFLVDFGDKGFLSFSNAAQVAPLYMTSGFMSNQQVNLNEAGFPGTYFGGMSQQSTTPASVTGQESFPSYYMSDQLAWRFTVSGVTTYPTNGAIYKDANNNQHVMAYGSSGVVVGYPDSNLPPASGTLTKVSGTGDATITYSSYTT